MKRLTINETWDECLAMWKWISRQCLGRGPKWCERNIDRLKLEWLSINSIAHEDLDHDCFFCEYDYLRKDRCMSCPAKKFDKVFNCGNKAYVWDTKPRLFYAELKRLNKIRLEGKKK